MAALMLGTADVLAAERLSSDGSGGSKLPQEAERRLQLLTSKGGGDGVADGLTAGPPHCSFPLPVQGEGGDGVSPSSSVIGGMCFPTAATIGMRSEAATGQPPANWVVVARPTTSEATTDDASDSVADDDSRTIITTSSSSSVGGASSTFLLGGDEAEAIAKSSPTASSPFLSDAERGEGGDDGSATFQRPRRPSNEASSSCGEVGEDDAGGDGADGRNEGVGDDRMDGKAASTASPASSVIAEEDSLLPPAKRRRRSGQASRTIVSAFSEAERRKLRRQFSTNGWLDMNSLPCWPLPKKSRRGRGDDDSARPRLSTKGVETKKNRLFLNSIAAMFDGVDTAKSTLGRKAGFGLFASRPEGFKKNEIITEFVGWLVDRVTAEKLRKDRRASHIVAVQRGFLYIDGEKFPHYGIGGGSFANDGSEFLGGPGNNSEFYHCDFRRAPVDRRRHSLVVVDS